MLMKNRAATKNRNKMWNLACVSGSCFFRAKGGKKKRDESIRNMKDSSIFSSPLRKRSQRMVDGTSDDFTGPDHHTTCFCSVGSHDRNHCVVGSRRMNQIHSQVSACRTRALQWHVSKQTGPPSPCRQHLTTVWLHFSLHQILSLTAQFKDDARRFIFQKKSCSWR